MDFKKPIMKECLCIVILLGCAACSQATPSPVIRTPTVLPATLTATPTLSLTPTETLTPAPTLTPTPQQELQVINYDVLPELPDGAGLDGVVAMVHQVPDGVNNNINTYLTNGYTGEKIADLPPYPASSINQFGFSVSPNGNWLAYYAEYFPGPQVHLYIVNARGQMVVDQLVVNSSGEFMLDQLTPGAGGWGGYINWLDDDRLVTEKLPSSADDWENRQAFSTILYEPFNGIVREYCPIFPDTSEKIWRSNIHWDFGGYEGLVLGPSLTRIIYGRDDGSVSLWNLEAGREITLLPHAFDWGGPVWNMDGSSFVINFSYSLFGRYYPDDLTLVDRDGEVSRLTELGTKFTQLEMEWMRWSPNGRKIAFIMKASPDPCTGENEGIFGYPAVVDLDASQSVKLYCVWDIYFVPLWSPDGNQLLLPVEKEIDTRNYSAVLLDMEGGYAATWIDGDYPVAWMPDSQE